MSTATIFKTEPITDDRIDINLPFHEYEAAVAAADARNLTLYEYVMRETLGEVPAPLVLAGE